MSDTNLPKGGSVTAPVKDDSTSLVVKNAPSLIARFSERYGVDPSKMLDTLQKTCFKPAKDGKPVTTEQLMMLMVVADQHKLNPFTREIYAFPSKDGGIVPIIGVDGWVRMINEHPQFDGMEFEYGPILDSTDDKGKKSPVVVNEWIECIMYRKDRQHAIRVKEYIVECRRNSEPWNSMPRRMLRHKAMMQCARYAFGFAGYDEDDYERITDGTAVVSEVAPMVRGRHHVPKNVQDLIPKEPAESKADAPAEEVTDVDAVPAETVTDDGEVIEQDDNEQFRRDEAVTSIETSLHEDMTPARMKSLMEYIDKCRPLIGDAYHQNFSHRLSQKMNPDAVKQTGKTTRKLF